MVENHKKMVEQITEAAGQLAKNDKKWLKKEKLPSDRLGEIVGQKGTVFWVNDSNISTQYFVFIHYASRNAIV